MIYDEKKHYNLVFNEIQNLGYFSNFSIEYYRKRSEQAYAASNGKPIVKVNNLKEFGLACLLIAIAFAVGCALCFFLPCGKSVIFHMVAAAAFFIAGIVSIKSNTKYTHLNFKDPLSDNICGALLLAEAVVITAMWFNLPFETDWECNFFIAGTGFVAVGLVLLVSFVMLITKRSRLYTRSVDATCIGYVRTKTVSNDPNHGNHNRWYNSPVFRYNAGGREIVAFYDTLSFGIDAQVPLGPCTININEENPGAVHNPSMRGKLQYLVWGLILIAIGFILFSSVLNGNVDGSSLHL